MSSMGVASFLGFISHGSRCGIEFTVFLSEIFQIKSDIKSASKHEIKSLAFTCAAIKYKRLSSQT